MAFSPPEPSTFLSPALSFENIPSSYKQINTDISANEQDKTLEITDNIEDTETKS